MAKITHNVLPATQRDLSAIYGGKPGLTPKIRPERLEDHSFDHWMIPNLDFHPFLPPRPGWPGLILRLNDGFEEWCPEEGTDFRVVIKREPRSMEYVGQYQMVRLNDVTPDEWKSQPPEVIIPTLSLFLTLKAPNNPSQVRQRWSSILGGGQSAYDGVIRVALRKRLRKEPSNEDFAKFVENLNAAEYKTLAKELTDDVDAAFCKGDEVYVSCIPPGPESNYSTMDPGYRTLGDEVRGI